MKRPTIVIIIYILGILFGALFLGVWDYDSGFKAILAMIWTAIFLAAYVYA
ncbi:MAG: hypothetical protein ACJZ4G_04025 [Candidatus Pelagibacter sp.]|jgi:hypothetical protein|tara:strand:+ start:114 stop:266 length:153 start_codon:yes stop_codon:yes gene_type:complete